MALSGSARRRKGHDFERSIAARFREIFSDYNVKRGLQTRHRENDRVPDVDIPCFWVECKKGKRTNIKAALAQALRDSAQGRTPVAICMDDRQKPTATLLLDDFLELVESWWTLTNQ